MNTQIFGTDGIRQSIGKSPLTTLELVQLGSAIGKWLIKSCTPAPQIIIGSDTRESKDFVKCALTTGLLQTGMHIIDTSIISTPGLVSIITQIPNSLGIMISASHNQYRDNGIKIIKSTGKLNIQEEQEISHIFYKQDKFTYTTFGSYHTKDFSHLYIDHLIKYFGNLDIQKKRIVLDCAHGAVWQLAPAIFKRLGAEVLPIFNTPNGKNINDQCGAVQPTVLQQTVLHHNADIGFAFDGDGDRVIICTRNGIIKDGDHVLALLSLHHRYCKERKIVGTIMNNLGLESFLEANDKKLIRTAVGDKYVANELHRQSLKLGGESSGHIILKDILPSGDGIAAALAILETIIQLDNWEMNLFKKIPQINASIAIKEKKDLTAPPLCDIISHYKKLLKSGRLVVRYSGTEPIARIMLEDPDIKRAQTVCKSLIDTLQQML